MEKGYHLPVKEALKIMIDWDSRDEDYKRKILNTAMAENPSKEDIQKLYALMRID